MGMAPGLEPDVWWGPRNLEMAFYNIPINLSSVKYAQRTVPGVADAGVLHGGEDSPVTAAPGSPRCLGGKPMVK